MKRFRLGLLKPAVVLGLTFVSVSHSKALASGMPGGILFARTTPNPQLDNISNKMFELFKKKKYKEARDAALRCLKLSEKTGDTESLMIFYTMLAMSTQALDPDADVKVYLREAEKNSWRLRPAKAENKDLIPIVASIYLCFMSMTIDEYDLGIKYANRFERSYYSLSKSARQRLEADAKSNYERPNDPSEEILKQVPYSDLPSLIRVIKSYLYEDWGNKLRTSRIAKKSAYPDAIKKFKAALALFDVSHDRSREAYLRESLAETYYDAGMKDFPFMADEALKALRTQEDDPVTGARDKAMYAWRQGVLYSKVSWFHRDTTKNLLKQVAALEKSVECELRASSDTDPTISNLETLIAHFKSTQDREKEKQYTQILIGQLAKSKDPDSVLYMRRMRFSSALYNSDLPAARAIYNEYFALRDQAGLKRRASADAFRINMELARKLRTLGFLDEASTFASTAYENFDSANAEIMQEHLTSIGQTYMDVGRYEKARKCFIEAIPQLRSLKYGRDSQHFFLDQCIADCFLLEGNREQAVKYYERALTHLAKSNDRFGLDSSRRLVVLELADADIAARKYASAEKRLTAIDPGTMSPVDKLLESHSNDWWKYRYFVSRTKLATSLGQRQVADGFEAKAMALISKSSIPLKNRLTLLARFYENKGQFEKATRVYKYLEMQYEDSALKEDKEAYADMLHDFGATYSRTGHHQYALTYYHKSIDLREKIRETTNSIPLRIVLDARNAKTFDQIIVELLRSGSDKKDLFELTEAARARGLMDQISSAAMVAAPVKRLSLAEIQNRLSSDTALVSYYALDNATIVFTITRDTFYFQQLPLGRNRLKKSFAQAFKSTQCLVRPETLSSLYTQLVRPVIQGLSAKHNLILVPHGPLHLLPFAAMPTGNGKYLNDLYNISYLPTASLLGDSESAPKTLTNESTLVMAQAQPTSRHYAAYLPFVNEEASQVSARLRCTAMTGESATEENLRRRAGSANLIHLAAHAMVDQTDSPFSLVALQGSADPRAPHDNDGDLERAEVEKLDLHEQAPMVVLSACQTQRGSISTADELQSLNRAFLAAGASTVVSTLWAVDDQSTAIFMESFYDHLLHGENAATAVGLAQRDMREKLRFAPYQWAPFCVSGNGNTRFVLPE